MIVITEIKILETQHDWIEFAYSNLPQLKYTSPGELVADKEYFMKELVRGRRFIKPNGEEIVIGITNQASEILGILYESYDNMNRELISGMDELRSCRSYLSDCKYDLLDLSGWIKISIWRKLYWLIFDCVRYENRKPKL